MSVQQIENEVEELRANPVCKGEENKSYPKDGYDLIKRNCVHFTQQLAIKIVDENHRLAESYN